MNPQTQKAIIFDSSTLISFSMNSLLGELKGLRKIFKGKFIITKEVKKEIVDKPLTIKRFELEALRIKQLLDDKVLELPSSFGVSDGEISKRTSEILEIANNTFSGNEKEIHLIDSGEASCLALSRMLEEKRITNVIAVDERTMRMLGEKPENLKKLLQKKMHTEIAQRKENFRFFRGFRFIRSSELVYVAYKKGIVNLKNRMVLDALLYAVKFKGCSISDKEIQEIKSF